MTGLRRSNRIPLKSTRVLTALGALIALALLSALPLCAQSGPRVVMTPFAAEGEGVSGADAQGLYQQVWNEMGSWGIINLLNSSTGSADEYEIRGTLSRAKGGYRLSALTIKGSSGSVLTKTERDFKTLGDFSGILLSFCDQAVESLPLPNYLLGGKWQSVLDLGDGPLTCIIEFQRGRVANVVEYDTYEYKENNALRYYSFGKGSYSYFVRGRRNRTLKDGSSVPCDGFLTLSLNLENTLDNYAQIDQKLLIIAFDEGKNSFVLYGGSLPCGQNFGGTTIYPQRDIAYSRFTRIK